MDIERAIQELRALRLASEDPEIRRSGPQHRSWKAKTVAVLGRSLGESASVVQEFRDLRYHVGVWSGAPGEAEQDARYFSRQADHAAALIDAAIYELGLAGEKQREDAGAGVRVRHFVDDDTGYAQWLEANPGGFVLNTTRAPSATYLVLHRARCRTISAAPARGSTFTGEYSKVCGSEDGLEVYAREVGGTARPCAICLRRADGPAGAGNGKYAPLAAYLAQIGSPEARMTFAELEALVGPLPESARHHRAWWSNSSNAARSWTQAGWHLRSVDQRNGEVLFARGAKAVVGHSVLAGQSTYVDTQVITALKAKAGTDRFDHAKLLKLVDELNDNHSRGNVYAAHALLRAILDHIPPLLGCADFKAVASNYPWGRTDRSYMRRLADFRLQADDALHRQVSVRPDLLTFEDLPPRTWINRLLQECAG